jgi:hypothetical protein
MIRKHHKSVNLQEPQPQWKKIWKKMATNSNIGGIGKPSDGGMSSEDDRVNTDAGKFITMQLNIIESLQIPLKYSLVNSNG